MTTQRSRQDTDECPDSRPHGEVLSTFEKYLSRERLFSVSVFVVFADGGSFRCTTKTLDPTLIPGVIMLDICVNNVTSATIAPTVSNAGVLHRPQDQLLAKDHSGFPWRNVRRKQTNL